MRGLIFCMIGTALILVGGSMISTVDSENFNVLFTVVFFGAMIFGIGASMFDD